MNVKVAFLQLSDCWGCHQSFLDAHLGLLPILPAVEIVYWPAVVDFKLDSIKSREDGEILVSFIEGCIRTIDDEKLAKLFRKKSQFLISFGACACYGNVSGLANLTPLKDQIERKYKTCETIDSESKGEPTINVSGFREKVNSVDDIVTVDAYLNGCPPRTEQIVGIIQFLLGQKPFPMRDLSYCTQCSIKEDCLLDKGVLCFGSITSMGCVSECTADGNACVGCMGPAKTVDSRSEKLKEFVKNIDNPSSRNIKYLNEFLTLFLNIPLISGFELRGDILKQIKTTGDVSTPLTNLPPSTLEVVNGILAYMKEQENFLEISNVCDTCSRIRGKKKMTRVLREHEGISNQSDCFIEQGYLCMGPITKAGCGAQCIKVNAPCSGCYGQTKYGINQAERFANIIVQQFNIALTKEELLSQIKDPIGIFEKFTLAKNKNYQ
ncbi:MAG: hypothetical protein ACFFC3_06445 [Candidatus Odinarchaeota archaeon]